MRRIDGVDGIDRPGPDGEVARQRFDGACALPAGARRVDLLGVRCRERVGTGGFERRGGAVRGRVREVALQAGRDAPGYGDVARLAVDRANLVLAVAGSQERERVALVQVSFSSTSSFL